MAKRFSVFTEFTGIDKISKPLTRMQSKLMKFQRAAKRVAGNVKKFGKRMAVGFTAGVAAIGAGLFLLKKQIDGMAAKMDTLAKTARRIEFPIEAMQEFRFVAEQSGLSVEEFDKGLETMTKRLGESKLGVGALYSTLNKSNPALLAQIQGAKDSAQALDVMLNAIRLETDATKKMALATTFFGKAGAKFINITHNSADALKALREEARQNGVVTQQTAEAAEAYNDAMNSLNKTLEGLRVDVLGPLIPIFKDLALQARGWLQENKAPVLDKLRRFADFITKNFDTIVKWAKYIGIAVAVVGTLVLAVLAVSAAISGVAAIFAAKTAIIVVAIGALVVATVAAGAKIIEALGVAWDIVTGLASGAIIGLKNMWAEFTTWLSGAIDEAFGKVTALWDKIKKFGGGLLETVVRTVGGSDAPQATNGPQVTTPAEATARLIEKRVTNSAEVTIRDESGKAQVTQGGNFPGFTFASSGAF